MAYIKKNRVYLIKKAVVIAICTFCSAAVFSLGYMLYGNVLPKETAGTSGSSYIHGGKTVTVARAKHNMSQGELLDEGKAELLEVPAEMAPEGAVTSLSKLNGMRLRRGIVGKEFFNDMDIVPESASYEEGDRLIEHNFAEGAVPASVSAGSIIDIKLFIKGGEDSTVISKAAVISRSDDLLSFYLDGREQEYIKEAAAEGMLFAVRYIDTSQQASEVTYIPLYNKVKSD